MREPDSLGATWTPGGCHFVVWAPNSLIVDVHVLGHGEERVARMVRDDLGMHRVTVPGVGPEALYRFRLDDGRELPDPASRLQPHGVHGPSQVVPRRRPAAHFPGVPLEELVVYEVHVGTFTAEGTLDSAIGQLGALAELGVTAVELMPLAAFPGRRNWGYDGVFPFSVHAAYGGPDALARFVDAAHALGLAVILDVVYNHLGPEGNVAHAYGPYFTGACTTPWGDAINFDGPGSDGVRRTFVESALQWIDEHAIDGLRLDAVHAIFDRSPRPFLEELATAVHDRARALGRTVHVIAESDANDPRIVRPREAGGLGHDAVWADDLHHALHSLLTGERHGYYRDYGTVDHLARALRRGFAYAGEHSVWRDRRHGADPAGVPGWRFVVCAQNHDQVGNRALGGRLSVLVSRDALALAAATVLLSSFIPLLFMGEEYGETAPFPFFIDHEDPELVEAVRVGRAQEHPRTGGAAPPDPASEATFRMAVLDRSVRDKAPHAGLLALHRALLALRREEPFRSLDLERQEVRSGDSTVTVLRHGDGVDAFLVLRFAADPVEVPLPGGGGWTLRLDTTDCQFGGEGSVLTEVVGREQRALWAPPWAAVLVTRTVAR